MMNSLDRIELVHGKHFKIELMNVICRSENMNMKKKNTSEKI